MAYRWDASKPGDNDQVSDVANQWQQDKASLNSWLKGIVWWSNSVASGGHMYASTSTPGTARAFYIPRSEVSSRRDVDIVVISDESRLAVVTSADSVVVYSKNAMLSYPTTTTGGIPSMALSSKVVACSGGVSDTSAALGGTSSLSTKITYGVTYGAAPVVYTTSASTTGAALSGCSFTCAVSGVGTSTCSLNAEYVGPGSAGDLAQFYWRSLGTVSLI